MNVICVSCRKKFNPDEDDTKYGYWTCPKCGRSEDRRKEPTWEQTLEAAHKQTNEKLSVLKEVILEE